MPNYLYHSTHLENLFSILDDKILIPNKGFCMHDSEDQNKVCLSDIFNDYLFVMFGDYVIEFKESLFEKNQLVPTSYEYMKIEYPEDYKEMAFEESEWTADKVIFDYQDINRIICIKGGENFLSLKEVLKRKFNIKLDIIDKKQVPKYSLNFFYEKYLQRLNLCLKTT